MNGENDISQKATLRHAWLYDALLVLLLIIGFSLRFVGTEWDEGEYLHPDERFLMFVESSIQPVQSIAEYFDTTNSTLNPHNMGHNLFVYGTWPIFTVRYLLEWLGTAGSQVYQIGRPLSALASLGTILLVYLVGTRLYDRRVGLLAAAFSTFSVLDIQLSHFFKEDTFMTFFAFLTLYIGAVIATKENKPAGQTVKEAVTEGPPGELDLGLLASPAPPSPASFSMRQVFRGEGYLFILFGIFLAMAMASKINAFPIAFVLPLAVLIRIYKLPSPRQERGFLEGLLFLILGGVVSFVTFRLIQPYAFTGPGFFGIRPNPRWLENFAELSRLASPDSIFGFPPALQWADRSVWFSIENIIRWGLGIPLGLAAWFGFLWVAWRMIRGEWTCHAVLWVWTAGYFIWQSSVFNPTMRYQLPIYPALVIYAAWAIFGLWDKGRLAQRQSGTEGRLNWWHAVAGVLGIIVLGGTAIWALAFTGIYTRPVTRVAATRWIYQNIPGPLTLHLQTENGQVNQPIPYPYDLPLRSDLPFGTVFVPKESGLLSEITLFKVTDLQANPGEEILTLNLTANASPVPQLGSSAARVDAPAHEFGNWESVTFEFDPPVSLVSDETYQLQIILELENQASYTIAGAALANEFTWDDGLPRRMYGYDGFGGIYSGLNLEMYWEDTPDKRDRFMEVLNAADYVMITSSRQWGSVGRLEDHYPISTAYYRALLGCPAEQLIEDCYNQADLGSYAGRLGFELIQVFDSNPSLGFLEFNDQPSEEAFTVYDHPKVFIFEKTDAYDPNQINDFFSAIDLPRAPLAGQDPGAEPPKSLVLEGERLEEQRLGGTWSTLFDVEALVNRSQVVSIIAWYLSLALVGILAYPLVRMALPGLDDRGYPLSRIVGMLLVSYLVWLGSSFRLPFERLWISVAILTVGILGGIAAMSQRHGLRQEWKKRRTYFLLVEALFLGIFIFGLFIRLGNPDLWHPWKGGEKPMDFSYFNAVLKSTSFPPYDPWYAGGYINYYYYGFVFVGVLVKWLGIVPAVAYNLILPTLFAMIALGAFSLGWNLRQASRERLAGWQISPWFTGLAASFSMMILGNLGILRMIVRGYQRLAAAGVSPDEVGFLTRWLWTIQGFFRALAGTSLPYGIADWYWNPSRAIPAPGDVEPITEFPFFTFLYADLHAHLIALPLTILVLAWVISLILARGRWGGILQGLLGFLLGGLAIGALRPTNTWDFYPYLALGLVAIVYAVGVYYRPTLPGFGDRQSPRRIAGLLAALLGMALLALLAHVLFQPYADWYGQGYNTANLWKGTRTPIFAYFDHWGVFLFFILSWMAWETLAVDGQYTPFVAPEIRTVPPAYPGWIGAGCGRGGSPGIVGGEDRLVSISTRRVGWGFAPATGPA